MLSRWKVLTKTFPRFLPQRQKGNIGRHLWDRVDILRSFYAKDKPTVFPAIHQELGVSGNLWLAYKTFDVSFKSEEWRSFNRMDWIPYYYKISNIKIEHKNKQIPTYCVGVWSPLAWENGQRFVTPPLVSVLNDVWGTTTQILTVPLIRIITQHMWELLVWIIPVSLMWKSSPRV